jgi:prevent-host-death family protein
VARILLDVLTGCYQESTSMTITIMNTIEAKEQFTDLINRVSHSKERIIITRRGKELAVIIPLEDFNLLQESQDKNDLRDAIDALKEARSAGAIDLEQIKEQIGN